MKKIIKILCLMFVTALAFTACKGEDEMQIIIATASNNETYGTVTGGGTYNAGTTVTLTAIPAEDCSFLRWDDGVTENPRTFKASESKIYTAIFGKTPQGDGTCAVSWNGTQWNAAAVYAVALDQTRNYVTLEIYKDPADTQAPMLVCQFVLEEGTQYASQENQSFMVLYFDYPNQTGNYNGQQIPLYQATQGLSMTIDAIDPYSGIVSGQIEGQYLNVEEYSANPDTPKFYPLEVHFNATHWTEMF